jgi:hypothetical protein
MKKMGWAGNAARMREMRNKCEILAETLKERDHPGKIGVDGEII